MDFRDEIGKKLQLHVTIWQPDLAKAPVVGFGVEGHDLDMLLFDARSPEQKERDRRRMEHSLDLDYVPSDRWSRRRQIDPDYGTLRMYHLSGNPLAKFTPGDQWEVEVTKCYLNPNESRTKDGRKKIHYSVRPIERIEEIFHVYDPKAQKLQLQYRCGSNRRVEDVPCDVCKARYRITELMLIVETEMVVPPEGKGERFWNGHKLTSLNELLEAKRRAVGRSFDPRPIQNDYKSLPQAPKDLLESIGR